ncbi:MAG: hypothetical protein V8S96_08625 [Lachnospiraceae bacterium]
MSRNVSAPEALLCYLLQWLNMEHGGTLIDWTEARTEASKFKCGSTEHTKMQIQHIPYTNEKPYRSFQMIQMQALPTSFWHSLRMTNIGFLEKSKTIEAYQWIYCKSSAYKVC